jgi:hypothetical protein
MIEWGKAAEVLETTEEDCGYRKSKKGEPYEKMDKGR